MTQIESEISEILDYKPKVSYHSTYNYRRIQPQSSLPQLSVTGGASSVDLLINPCVFNPSKSKIEFILTLSATANKYNYVTANLMNCFSRVTLSAVNSGTLLCDLNYCSDIYNTISLPATKFTDYMAKSNAQIASGAYNTTGAVYTLGNMGIQSSSENAQLYPVEDISRAGVSGQYVFAPTDCVVGTTNAIPFIATKSLAINFGSPNFHSNDGTTAVDTALRNPYLTPKMFYTDTNAVNTAGYLAVTLSLSSFKHCILSLNKNLYFNENLLLSIYFNAGNKFTFAGADPVNPNTTVLSSSGVSVSNMYLSIACETNPIVIAKTRELVDTQGISLPVYWLTCVKQSINSSSPSYSINLQSGYGRSLIYIASSFYNSTVINNTSQCHTRGTLSSYQTFLDSVYIKQPAPFNALWSEDYTIANNDYLKSSAIQTLSDYVYNWVHIDSFASSDNSLSICDLDMTDVDGMSLDGIQHTYQLSATLSAATNYLWVTVICGQKLLQITKDRVSVS